MHRKTDISVDFYSNEKNELDGYFFIPIDHLIDDDPLVKTIQKKGYWPTDCKDMQSNLVKLFIDTTRSRESYIHFNNVSADDCVPSQKALDEDKEFAECLSRFDHFLDDKLQKGKENILKHYQQVLINFPGNVLFQALQFEGHQLKSKTFHADISYSADDNLPYVISRIQDLEYVPKGKDPFNEQNKVKLSGCLEINLQLFKRTIKKEDKVIIRKGFNVTLQTKNITILALMLGQLANVKYTTFLENYLKLKKSAYLLSNEMSAWIRKTLSSIDSSDKSNENEVTLLKASVEQIGKIFDKTALLHADLDLLLATQDRSQMSPKKLQQDMARLATCQCKFDQLAKSFRGKELKSSGLIQQRSEWFSKVKSSVGIIFEMDGDILSNLQKYPDTNSFLW